MEQLKPQNLPGWLGDIARRNHRMAEHGSYFSFAKKRAMLAFKDYQQQKAGMDPRHQPEALAHQGNFRMGGIKRKFILF